MFYSPKVASNDTEREAKTSGMNVRVHTPYANGPTTAILQPKKGSGVARRLEEPGCLQGD